MLTSACVQCFVCLLLCKSVTGRYHEKEEPVAHNDSGIISNVPTTLNQDVSSSSPLESTTQDEYDEIDTDLEKYKELLHNRLKQLQKDRVMGTQPEINKLINETISNQKSNEQLVGNMVTIKDNEINKTQNFNRTENLNIKILNLSYPSIWYHLINKNDYDVEITILNLLKDMESDEDDNNHRYDYSDISNSSSFNTSKEPQNDTNNQSTMNKININKNKMKTYGNEDAKSLNESRENFVNNEIDTNQNDQNKTVLTELNESKVSLVTRDIELQKKNETGNENKTNTNKEEESDNIIKGHDYREKKMDKYSYSPEQYITETNDDTLHNNISEQITEKKKEEGGMQETKSPKSTTEIRNKTNGKLYLSASVTSTNTLDKEKSEKPIVELELTSTGLYATESPKLYAMMPSNKSNEEEIKELKTFQITPPNTYHTYKAEQYSSTSDIEYNTSTKSELIPEPESVTEDMLVMKPTQEPKSLTKQNQAQDAESKQTTQSLSNSKTTNKFKTDELISTENPKSIHEPYSIPSKYSNAAEKTTPEPDITSESKSTKTNLILEAGHTTEPDITPNPTKKFNSKSLTESKEIYGLGLGHTTKSLFKLITSPLLNKTEPLSTQKMKLTQEAESTPTQYSTTEAITLQELKSTKEKYTPEIENVPEPENISNEIQVNKLKPLSESKQSLGLESSITKSSLPEPTSAESKQTNPLSKQKEKSIPETKLTPLKYSKSESKTTLEPKFIPEPNPTRALPKTEKAQESESIRKHNETPKSDIYVTPEPELTELTESTTECMIKEPEITVNTDLKAQQPSSSIAEATSEQTSESKSSQSENNKMSTTLKSNEISNITSTTMPDPESMPESKPIYPVSEQNVKSIPESELTPLKYSKIEPRTTPEPKIKAEPKSTKEKLMPETEKLPEPEPTPKKIQTTKSHSHTTPESELIEITKSATERVTNEPELTVSPESKGQQPSSSKSEKIAKQTSNSSQSNNYKLSSTSKAPLENNQISNIASTALPVTRNPVSAFLTSQQIKTHLTPESKLKQQTENLSYIENKTVMNYSSTTVKPSQDLDLEISDKNQSIEDNQKLNSEYLNNIGSFNFAYNHHKVENNLNHKHESINETNEISKMENNNEKINDLTTKQKSDYKMKNSESTDLKIKPPTDIFYEMNENVGTELTEGTPDDMKQKNVNVSEKAISNDSNTTTTKNNNTTLKSEAIYSEADIFESTSVASENETIGTELNEGISDDSKQKNVNVSKISYPSLISNENNTTLKSEPLTIEADIFESTSVAGEDKQTNLYDVSPNTPQVGVNYQHKRFSYSHAKSNNEESSYDFEDNDDDNSDLKTSTPNELKKLVHYNDLTTPMGLQAELLHYDDMNTPTDLQKESLPSNDTTTPMELRKDDTSTPMEMQNDDTNTPTEIQKELLHYDDSNYISKKSNIEAIDYSEVDKNINSPNNSSTSTESINKYNFKNTNSKDNFSTPTGSTSSSEFQSLESPKSPVQITTEEKSNKTNPDEANDHQESESADNSKYHINDQITTVPSLYTKLTSRTYSEPTPIELDYVQDQPEKRNTKIEGT